MRYLLIIVLLVFVRPTYSEDSATCGADTVRGAFGYSFGEVFNGKTFRDSGMIAGSRFYFRRGYIKIEDSLFGLCKVRLFLTENTKKIVGVSLIGNVAGRENRIAIADKFADSLRIGHNIVLKRNIFHNKYTGMCDKISIDIIYGAMFPNVRLRFFSSEYYKLAITESQEYILKRDKK